MWIAGRWADRARRPARPLTCSSGCRAGPNPQGSTDRSPAPRTGAHTDDMRPRRGMQGGVRVRREDVSISALHAAVRGLSQPQRAIPDDIANVNTPFFRGRSVAFEGDLKRALAGGDDPLGVTPTVTASAA